MELKRSKVIQNHLRQVETSIIIDLNILSKMNKVMTGETTYKNSGLKDLVKTLNRVGGLCLSPGFAFNEADAKLIHKLTKSYELFLEKYCPTYMDHPGAIKTNRSESRTASFSELPTNEKYVNSITYLSILKIQLIMREDKELSPESKFKKYVDYLALKADMVGAIEAEAAKYVFFEHSMVSDQALKVFCKKIKDNFKKGGNTPEKLLNKCLNSARDIVYYRLAARQQNEVLDGKSQDTWLLTADDGLVNLTNSVYFVPQIDGDDSKYITYFRHKEQNKSDYWSYCDNLFIKTVEERDRIDKIFGKDDFSRLMLEVEALEERIAQTFESTV